MARKRVFIVKLPPLALQDIDKFMERLSKHLIGDPVLIKYKNGALRVEVYGGDVLARKTRIGIKKVLEEFTQREVRGRSLRVIPARSIYREAGVAIPLDVLELVLRINGYEARVTEEGLESSAPVDEVFVYAGEIGRLLESLSTLEASRTAKKLFLAVASLTGASPLEIIDAGFNLDVLEEDDEGKLFVRGDWREAVKKVVSELGKGGFG
ncbi:MAG: DUF2067 domain-containing protein [Desulfurococcales archaeon]|nr:DUF2067 domain-containing protein [Desulfurococcales archaeon]